MGAFAFFYLLNMEELWTGWIFALGSMNALALLMAVGASPNPQAINFTFPSYVQISPAA